MPADSPPAGQHVEITITGGCGHVLGTWTDSVSEKYPVWCIECEETLTGKYPWTITTRITCPG